MRRLWTETMSNHSVIQVTHRGLGAMLRLTVADARSFDLTLEEARTVARALAAVRDGKSKVDEIYMSPIASDRDFSAKVTLDGLLLEGAEPPLRLEWPEVGAIAASLAELAGPG
jgi:predicted Zn-dependent protease